MVIGFPIEVVVCTPIVVFVASIVMFVGIRAFTLIGSILMDNGDHASTVEVAEGVGVPAVSVQMSCFSTVHAFGVVKRWVYSYSTLSTGINVGPRGGNSNVRMGSDMSILLMAALFGVSEA